MATQRRESPAERGHVRREGHRPESPELKESRPEGVGQTGGKEEKGPEPKESHHEEVGQLGGRMKIEGRGPGKMMEKVENKHCKRRQKQIHHPKDHEDQRKHQATAKAARRGEPHEGHGP